MKKSESNEEIGNNERETEERMKKVTENRKGRKVEENE